MESTRFQGALEYLIVIAAVLAIAAIVVLFVSGSFGVSKKGADVSACKAAAARCSVEKATSPGAPCDYCEQECSGLGSIFVTKCKQGAVDEISSTLSECENKIINSYIDGEYVELYESADTYYGSGSTVVMSCSYIEGSQITNSHIESSTVLYSTLEGAYLVDAYVDPSTVENSSLDDANVTNSSIYYSNVSNSFVSNSSTVYNSSVDNAVTVNSSIYDSEVVNSTVHDNSTVYNSSVVSSVISLDSTVHSSVVENSTITNSSNVNNSVTNSSTLISSVVVNSSLNSSTFNDSVIYNSNLSEEESSNATYENNSVILYCSDGTPYGQCSETKPLYCDNGTLVPKCSICGCDAGYVCNVSGECQFEFNESNESGNFSLNETSNTSSSVGANESGNVSSNESSYANVPPVARFTYHQQYLSLFVFNDTSYDPDGTILWHYWNFGDGLTYNTTSWTVYHNYSSPGFYNVTLIVCDNSSEINSTWAFVNASW